MPFYLICLSEPENEPYGFNDATHYKGPLVHNAHQQFIEE